MSIVILTIPDKIANDWKQATGFDLCKLVEDSVALYAWMLQEVWRGRVVFSCDPEMKSVWKITAPSLECARAHRLRLLTELGSPLGN